MAAPSTAPAGGEWLELSVSVEREAVEAVSEVFQRWGQGVAIEEPISSSADGESYRIDHARPVVVKTYLPMDEQTAGRHRQVEQALWHLGQLRPLGPLETRVLHESHWANAWKQYFFVQHIGRRLVIVPSWRRYVARAGEVMIRLDPGMAFGTGLHPTTRLCLESLEDWLVPSARVLDLGTGSGILALAAARLGAERVLALDVDAVAVRVATENVRRNRLQRCIAVEHGSLPLKQLRWLFDLVVANISRRVVLDLLDAMVSVLAPGGTLILSGLLAEAEAEMRTALAARRAVIQELRQDADWLAIVARLPGQPG